MILRMLGRTLNLCVLAALSILQTRAYPQQITASESGITATADGVTLQVTALREDILRVRMWQGNTAPEDASWAVLPHARTSTVPVTTQALGFTTKSLNVTGLNAGTSYRLQQSHCPHLPFPHACSFVISRFTRLLMVPTGSGPYWQFRGAIR
jgi:Domain of unknown function (DUF4968)